MKHQRLLSMAGLALATVVCLAALAAACAGRSAAPTRRPYAPPAAQLQLAREKIKHVIIIMQENRSFDHYFGAFPGAEGIPMDANGAPTVCVPDPAGGGCIRPYHDAHDVNTGGPHSTASSLADINYGLMDGFIAQQQSGHVGIVGCEQLDNPKCVEVKKGVLRHDVVGYHTDAEIPNYWAYAENFVLQDHMFAPQRSWSLPAHLYLLSEWSAQCLPGNPLMCKSSLGMLDWANHPFDFPWTNLPYLLYESNVTWKSYLSEGVEPDCSPEEETCSPAPLLHNVTSFWNPLPAFDTIVSTGQLGNIQTLDHFLVDAKIGMLPSVAWITPDGVVSEHPPNSVHIGEGFVTSLVNAVMESPQWPETAIFITWDEWGGFYDHLPPPAIDENGWGLRVPGLMISAYAKPGYIDKQVLSHDAYAKFIEDLFLGGARLDPATDGRPDARPIVREDLPILGNLLEEFDFTQPPRAPLILPVD